ncbi:hypothetical protein OnM2_053049 [Erysiphe neolycopersici]|uniref:Uncharacterized protein n=1 Tax=Erysiphe neolycopersici TaxID=212602 RepID=A0A420HS46_9PEZI|nr:hypothetical protein OnM2_053049 [Erysiphe neolycopersici]
MAECNACNKKGDAKKESPPPVVIPQEVDEPMTECNVCNKKGDAKKESPPPVVNPPMEKPISECSGNVLCNKKDGAIKPPPTSEPIPPVAKLPPPSSDPMQPTISSPMPSNSTVVIVVENHIAPCSVCGGKVQGGNNSPNSGSVHTGTPKIDAKPPPPPQLQPETKSDSKSGIKPEIKLDFKSEINQSKSPLPSSAPKPNTENSKLPIFTGDAITASLRSTTLNIVLLLSLFTTLLNLGGNFLLN